ncbi:tryptophan--tRNA ligase [Candidatus Roizmanbacteria bacterium]|nr:tryptophan--tRNA ligase [Candidatus Roizmanbacteria bacterium]
MKRIIFSGVQPSGNLHLGNLLGAINPWVNLVNTSSNENDFIFCIVDLHAHTVPQDPKLLREKILETSAIYLAAGIDPKKAHVFIQSENHDHSYLAWLFDCVTPYGWMTRMTQFKDKSAKQAEGTTVGLFNYPILMAADILLYDTTHVPVGEDQKQHVELARDIAEKFNHTYGDTFVLPEPQIGKENARIKSLQNPAKKMSKSENDPLGTVNLLDTPDEIVKKIKRAVTDSGTQVETGYDPEGGISNLLDIYAASTGKTKTEAVGELTWLQYGAFKEKVAEAVVAKLKPIQDRYREIRNDEGYLMSILDDGRDFSIGKSGKKIEQVKEKMGIGRVG